MGLCPSSRVPQKIMEALCVKKKEKENHLVEECKKIKGKVILMKKGLLDFHDMKASLLDRIHEILGKGVSIQLISAVNPDPGKIEP